MPLVLLATAATDARGQSLQELQNLSIEQLGNIDVTSVLRRPEPLSEAAASIYVISADDIRRSGAITLPEVLRLAPNLDVAQVTAQSYAISARGFNAPTASNKILVLIDGRPIYAPVFSGIYWDQQQVPLDTIERIEVISGPGGTQWGANAMNGVINIITKSSAATQGGLVDLKAGPQNQNGFVQYGGKAGENATYRVYGQGFGVGPTEVSGGGSAGDQWHGGQGGFRADWQLGADQVMTEGDVYRNNNALDGRQYGGDIVGRWNHHFESSDLQVQTSYDQEYRVMPGYSDTSGSFDNQIQDTFNLGRNVAVVGAEYRLMTDDLVNTANVFELIPARATVGVGDAFAQDTFAILPNLKLTFGTKLEDSTFSGLDFLPSVRLGWAVSGTQFLWAAISRAVRTPSNLDRDLTAPLVLAPASQFQSEKVIAYELGYRGKPTSNTSLSVSLYYNSYSDLRTTGLSTTGGYIFQLQNGDVGNTYGVEAWGTWSVFPWWRLSAGVNLAHKDLHLKPGFVDISDGQSEGFDPGYQLSARSSMDLQHGIEFDFGVRGVGHLTGAPIDGYVEGDGRLAWHATERLEVSLTAMNLFTPTHAETVTPGSPVYLIRRSIYFGLRWAL